MNPASPSYSVKIDRLNFKYRSEEHEPVLKDINVNIPQGARVLVTGVNGAGKSTLLSIIGGQRMIKPETSCLVLNRPAFNDSSLANDVVYLGSWWRNDYFSDLTITQCVAEFASSERFLKLARILDVNPNWIISKVSDGQRRRCQLLASLIVPKALYVLDEVTTDLDLPARDALMRLLKEESESTNATILFATHIFDTLEGWPTHILHMKDGRVAVFEDAEKVEFERFKQSVSHHPCPWYLYVRELLLKESDGHDRRISPLEEYN